MSDESGLNRKNIVDNRVHCCFYFISPYGHGLKPLDIDFMKQLSNKVICDDFVFFVDWRKGVSNPQVFRADPLRV